MPKPPSTPKPLFFDDAAAFRRWLEKHHAKETELHVGFFKKVLGRTTLAYFEALDEAHCFGWIDGVRRSLGDGRWTIRFSPRPPRSIWSLVNVRHVERLEKAGLMAPPGLMAFDGRERARSGRYSFELRTAPKLDRASAKAFREAARVDVLPGPAAGLQETHDALGRERGEARDPRAPPHAARRRFGRGPSSCSPCAAAEEETLTERR